VSDEKNISSVRRVRLRPGDKIVLTTQENLSQAQLRDIRRLAQEKFPGHEVLVLSRLDLKIIHEAPA
jgi:hypothetical protein